MTTLLVIIWFVLAIGLLFLAAVRPRRSRHSWFELKRMNDKRAMRREKLLGDVLALRRLLAGIFIVLLTALSLALWQAWGILVMITMLIVVMMLGGLNAIRRIPERLYEKYEQQILKGVENMAMLVRLLGTDRHVPRDERVESMEQLMHLIETSNHILSDDQRRILKNGLGWHETPVSKVMTPREKIITVKHNELLGPLVLDDLHRSGHAQFPVTKRDIDDIVGTINITDLLEIDGDRKSHYAEKIMTASVPRVSMDDTLPVTLRLLQKSRQHIIIVVNDEGQTAGIVTLTDIANSLLGNSRQQI